MPFGFVQLGPDTDDNPDDPASGYDYNKHTIVGFSHTHLSGTGVADLFDVLLMPTVGTIHSRPGDEKDPNSGYRSRFSHDQETAKVGYYQVKLLDYDINAELTATEHAGYHRYTYPKGKEAHVVIDMNHTLNKKRPYWSVKIYDSQIRIVNDSTVEGFRVLSGWVPLRKVYFHAVFSKPIVSQELFNGNSLYANAPVVNGSDTRAVLNFNTQDNNQLTVKVGLSAVSCANAALNLSTEVGSQSFDQVENTAINTWEKEFDNIAIDGTDEQKTIFYTGLYHAYTQPNNIADVNGDYMAEDFTTKKAKGNAYYSTFSLWDTYRAAHPLYTILQPKRTVDFINSMIEHSQTFGYLPIWGLWGEENYCMIGNHAIPVIVDAVLKGLKGFNYEDAYKQVLASATTDHPGSAFGLIDKYHYLPEDKQSQSVSMTVEMAYDDWCVAQFAKVMHDEKNYKFFSDRSKDYANLFDKSSGFFRAKNSDGKWKEPFNSFDYGGNGGSPYTEGNAWHYRFYVPQDVPALIALNGGRQKFVERLDSLFTYQYLPKELNGNASGFIGQYAHGNEPSHHCAYLYNYAGEPWKTQKYVSEILNTMYDSSISGYSGNDDCGQMSAWYILSAMGFYPVNPCGGEYQLGSPLLKKAVVKLANGNTFTMLAPKASKANIYIKSVKLNGKKYNKTFITQTDIENGATLEFDMTDTPNKKWGI